MATTIKHVDMADAVTIQSKVAEYAHSGNPMFANGDDYLGAPYSEGFYDNCVLYWIEAGFDEAEVKETVDAAIEELRRTFGN
jgi:hypothetical protein